MFEQSFLNAPAKTRRVWTVAVSFAAQLAAAGIAVLIPLIFVDRLPIARLAPFHLEAPPPPPPPGLPKPPHVQVVAVLRQFREGRLTEPTAIPAKPAIIVDPLLPPDTAPSGPGVPGGVPGGSERGVPGGILPLVPQYVPPSPPPPPGEAVKPPERPIVRTRVGGVIQEAKLVRQVIPVYPVLARQARVAGVVRLEALIGADGRIRELRAASGHPLLVPAAMEAVRQWIYSPTLLNGDRVEVETEIIVTFTLSR